MDFKQADKVFLRIHIIKGIVLDRIDNESYNVYIESSHNDQAQIAFLDKSEICKNFEDVRVYHQDKIYKLVEE